MFLLSICVLITLWYLIDTTKESIYKKDIYGFILISLYVYVYLNTPEIQDESQVLNRFEYVFSLYPAVAYYMILFPQSIFIPLHELFPELPDYLAERAIVVFSYVGLVFLLLMLFFVRFSHF